MLGHLQISSIENFILQMSGLEGEGCVLSVTLLHQLSNEVKIINNDLGKFLRMS